MLPGNMNRRTFIARSSRLAFSTLAAPMLCRFTRFGAGSRNSKLNIACIGSGGQMQGVIREISTFEQNVVALYDVDADRTDATRKSFGGFLAGARPDHEYRDLLEREESLDAVVIATPDHWHASICTAAIRAERHVYCEKPIMHSVAEARQPCSAVLAPRASGPAYVGMDRCLQGRARYILPPSRSAGMPPRLERPASSPSASGGTSSGRARPCASKAHRKPPPWSTRPVGRVGSLRPKGSASVEPRLEPGPK